VGEEVRLPLLHPVDRAPSRQLGWGHGFLAKQIVRLRPERLLALLSPLIERTYIHRDPESQDEVPGTQLSHRSPGIGGTPLLGLRQLPSGQPQHLDLISHQGHRHRRLGSMPRSRIADDDPVDVTRVHLPLGLFALHPHLAAATARRRHDGQDQAKSQPHAP
jgi:hypothetical protein